MPTWTLSTATHRNAREVVDFIDTARRGLFPMLADSPMPRDLACFEESYLEGEGLFLVAHDQGRLVACIGYLPYDHRFDQLDYRARRTVEVVRLFVVPEYRRHGLARELFAALSAAAQRAGVEWLYLHTHPFLPGALRFWEGQGFAIVDVEEDPVWRTTHMQRVV
ncbi:GNAT family N-acetyltransferase [Pseudomonas sichuanensis]|uniref:GNAT family N-acetyltransferase n=1 Tax=Pseudomonas sichuanensis TaxID=2213015 RepID=UPI0021601BF5|nr:GNAT family N-acetyltransferase [Pseudomonas sichuanensis]UVK85704.1 GNAT family N-acetyltransferase [Pseudomonas sichuanensis]